MECKCTYPGCIRKNNCEACVKYHREKRQLPACFFPSDAEKTYDRSFEFFVELFNERKV